MSCNDKLPVKDPLSRWMVQRNKAIRLGPAYQAVIPSMIEDRESYPVPQALTENPTLPGAPRFQEETDEYLRDLQQSICQDQRFCELNRDYSITENGDNDADSESTSAKDSKECESPNVIGETNGKSESSVSKQENFNFSHNISAGSNPTFADRDGLGTRSMTSGELSTSGDAPVTEVRDTSNVDRSEFDTANVATTIPIGNGAPVPSDGDTGKQNSQKSDQKASEETSTTDDGSSIKRLREDPNFTDDEISKKHKP